MIGEGDKLLKVLGVSKAFTAVQALNTVDFDLVAGEVHALVGENGAGKSTLVKIITGIEGSDSGQIKIAGTVVDIKNPHHARQLGVGAIFQELSQIPSLTVAENVFLGNEPKRAKMLLDRATMLERTRLVLEKYDIELDPATELSKLSAAQRQLAEIAKAVCLEPKILIMDEPTSALSEKETEIVFRIIADFKKSGTGIIYVSHRMDEIFKIADRVAVLRDGQLIDDRLASELDLAKVVELMVGREVELYQSRLKTKPQRKEVKLQVKNLSRKGAFSDVSFELYKGEILGIAGLVGAGRSEMAKAIFGVERIDSGKILLDGKDVRIGCVSDAMKLGIALLPESRHAEGLVLSHSVSENMTITILDKLKRYGLVNRRRADTLVKEKIVALDIRPAIGEKTIKYLSGGNQQKVVIGKWLLTEPKILIVDEPTAGIDVHSKSEIHRLLRGLANEGVSIIMISSEMSELLAHSDRVMVMNKGRVLGSFDDVSGEMIMSLIMQDNLRNKDYNKN